MMTGKNISILTPKERRINLVCYVQRVCTGIYSYKLYIAYTIYLAGSIPTLLRKPGGGGSTPLVLELEIPLGEL